MARVAVIGAGLAGSEASLVLARSGVEVDCFEMRPATMTPAHRSGNPAELVCSNSFKAVDTATAHGQLKRELELLRSPLLEIARQCRVPAGSALAVNREQFSARVLAAVEQARGCRLVRQHCDSPAQGYDYGILAAGPLVSPALAQWLTRFLGADSLSFYDAIAPVIDADSLDTGICFRAARHESGEGDYLNCPFTEEEFHHFYRSLVEADCARERDFEDARFFEACLPIEVVAARGYRALTFGAMRPVGLIDPRSGRRPFAVCQLRRETLDGTAWGMVGFQTRLTVGAQQRVLRMIPGMATAEFVRYGSIHRNTYIDSPRHLSVDLSFRADPALFCAGQLCGSEGYTESIATGHVAALALRAALGGARMVPPPVESAMGALLRHVTASPVVPFAPGSCNFGLFPQLSDREGTRRLGKKERHALLCDRASGSFARWVAMLPRPVS